MACLYLPFAPVGEARAFILGLAALLLSWFRHEICHCLRRSARACCKKRGRGTDTEAGRPGDGLIHTGRGGGAGHQASQGNPGPSSSAPPSAGAAPVQPRPPLAPAVSTAGAASTSATAGSPLFVFGANSTSTATPVTTGQPSRPQVTSTTRRILAPARGRAPQSVRTAPPARSASTPPSLSVAAAAQPRSAPVTTQPAPNSAQPAPTVNERDVASSAMQSALVNDQPGGGC